MLRNYVAFAGQEFCVVTNAVGVAVEDICGELGERDHDLFFWIGEAWLVIFKVASLVLIVWSVESGVLMVDMRRRQFLALRSLNLRARLLIIEKAIFFAFQDLTGFFPSSYLRNFLGWPWRISEILLIREIVPKRKARLSLFKTLSVLRLAGHLLKIIDHSILIIIHFDIFQIILLVAQFFCLFISLLFRINFLA